jgi:hypothetical protein
MNFINGVFRFVYSLLKVFLKKLDKVAYFGSFNKGRFSLLSPNPFQVFILNGKKENTTPLA